MAVGYMIWLTTACNLKCKYCYEGTAKVNCYLSKDYAAKIVDYIVPVSYTHLTLPTIA